MGNVQTVFIVDDCGELRESLGGFLRSAGLEVSAFRSAEEFINQCPNPSSGCLLLDIHMPQMSGLELQRQLQEAGRGLPVIVVSGSTQVMNAVRAMKQGAFDFFEKPFDSAALLERIRQAFDQDRLDREHERNRNEILRRFERLSQRERQVLELVVSGLQSKAIAAQMELAVSTVDNHRANLMRKLEAGTAAELTRIALSTGLFPGK